eukprot:365452-Chlamydomonas_euryale.AAC.19
MPHSIHTTHHAAPHPHCTLCHTASTLHIMPHSIHTTHHAAQHPHCTLCHTASTLLIMPHSIHTDQYAAQHPHCANGRPRCTLRHWGIATAHRATGRPHFALQSSTLFTTSNL